VSVRRVAFDFWLPDGSLGGFCSLVIGTRTAAYWAGLVGVDRPYVLVKDLAVEPPRRPDSWEIRSEGLWADHNCEEEAGEHWSFGLEAFGVAFDDPEEALRSEWGDRTALGFDLEWEPGVVHGEVLVGTERIAFDGLGAMPPEGFDRADVGMPTSARPDGLAAPVRLEDEVVRQWLTRGGWVRSRG
jgi:hypothetical protein